MPGNGCEEIKEETLPCPSLYGGEYIVNIHQNKNRNCPYNSHVKVTTPPHTGGGREGVFKYYENFGIELWKFIN